MGVPGGGMMNRGPNPLSMSSEKLYPPGQSMVFNPQNPNAPPIYPCGSCRREVHDNDQAILCESGCNFWFHRVCTGLAETAFHFLTQEVYAEWVCDSCFKTKKKIRYKNSVLAYIYTKMKSYVFDVLKKSYR